MFSCTINGLELFSDTSDNYLLVSLITNDFPVIWIDGLCLPGDGLLYNFGYLDTIWSLGTWSWPLDTWRLTLGTWRLTLGIWRFSVNGDGF